MNVTETSQRKPLPDVQSQAIARSQSAAMAGIDRVRAYAVLPPGDRILASLSISAQIPDDTRGVHMSRLYRHLVLPHEAGIPLEEPTLAERIRETARAQGSLALFVRIACEAATPRLAPMTGSPGYHPYKFEVRARWSAAVPEDVQFSTRVEGLALLGCPCSKALSGEAGFHNQRGAFNLEVPGFQVARIAHLLDLIDEAASSPIYPVLRREDEKETIDAIAREDRYRFVEDALFALRASLERDFGGSSIHVRSFESIHAHDAVAWSGPRGSRLGEGIAL